MTHRSYRKESKKDWGTRNSDGLSLEQINTGCLLRIADASEAMAKNHQKLIDDLDYYKRRYEESSKGIEVLFRRIAGLKGYIKRLKKGIKR